MKTEIISLTEDTIRFIVSGVDTVFANTLRRIMVSEVPIMTIDDIFYFDNSSLVPDEVLAHRIGLVPLKTDLDAYVLPEECDCEAELGCPKCRAVLTLDVEATDGIVTVYSGDLIPEDASIKPASLKIPLAKLAVGQAIRFEAYAQLGQGKVHAKWSPVSMCVFQNLAALSVKNKADMEACINLCGKEVAKIEGDKLKVIDIQSFERYQKCRESVTHDEIMRNLMQDEFFFTVESNGALSPERIVKEAVKILITKLHTLKEKIDDGKVHDEISDFETPEIDEGKLYSVGSGDYDDEEEGGEDEDFVGGDEEP